MMMIEEGESSLVGGSVNFFDEDYDEKYSSTNLFHGRKLNKN